MKQQRILIVVIGTNKFVTGDPYLIDTVLAQSLIASQKIDKNVGYKRSKSTAGRFLRHRPERSERCLNYEELYQGQPAWPNAEGVPKA